MMGLATNMLNDDNEANNEANNKPNNKANNLKSKK